MADQTIAGQPRLLYLIGQFPAINHSYLLAEIRHLRRLGFEVSVASVSTPDRSPEKLSQDEREEAARAYYLKSVPAVWGAFLNVSEFFQHPLRYLRGLIFALRLGRSPRGAAYHLAYFAEAILVGRYMRQLGVSHVHASFSATVSLIIARTFPVTMSFGVYGFGELHDPANTQLAERINGALFVRAISRHGRGQLMLACQRSEWSKLICVPLGIDASEFAPRPPQRAVSRPVHILCVGRLAPEKGQALLLEAIAALNVEGREAHLRLVGDGPDRNWLESRTADLGITSRVEFAGWVNQDRLMALYAETDIFALPSLAEGIPMVLMEAMAMQIPCVAPCITGIPELIEDGIDGLLFAVADVEDLTKKIRSLLESPELRAQIGKQARARVVRDYDVARNTERFATVLTEKLGGAGLSK